MKRKIYILFLTFLCVSFAFGQETNDSIQPLLTVDKIWSTGYHSLGGFTNSEFLKIWKDSVIEGKTYSLIIKSADEFHENWDTTLFWGLRKENQKIYYWDYLFYDFGLQVGDTIDYGWGDNRLKLDSIKFLPMLNGELRKHFYLSYLDYPATETWIEGLGSLRGLMTPYYAGAGGGGESLLCVEEKGEKIYQSPLYDGCYIKQKEDSILPLINKDRVWSVGHFGEFFPKVSSIGDWGEFISVRGDTLINGKKWWLFKSETGWSEDDLKITNQGGLYEENHKVYREDDLIYYDFGMQPGDSLNFCCNDVLYLDSIKKMQALNGELRRHYFLSYFHNQKYQWMETWIEGIGSPHGLFTPFVPAGSGGGSADLLCVKDNGVKTYQTTIFDGCFVPKYPTSIFLYLNKRWSVAKFDSVSGYTTTNYYTIDGDTVVEFNADDRANYYTMRFKKLYRSSQIEHRQKDYIGGLMGGEYSLYFLPAGESKEYMLYNFGLFPGDIFVSQSGSKDSLIVDSLVVKPFAGEERIHWYLSPLRNPGSPPIEWVDGIGRLGDLIDNTKIQSQGNKSPVLLCFEENGVQVYQNPEYNSCSINSSSSQTISQRKQFIELLPLGNSLLRLSTTYNGELMLYSLDGRVLQKNTIIKASSIVCVPGTGVLLYRFVTKNGEVQSGKVVVH